MAIHRFLLVLLLLVSSQCFLLPVEGGINCDGACSVRCGRSWMRKMCLKMCTVCCGKCNCVPPGTGPETKYLCPCYANMKNPKGKYKCP